MAIYFTERRLAEDMPIGEYAYSVITEIELLSWSGITETEEEAFRVLLQPMQCIQLTDSVKQQIIALRRQHQLKLPDALIAASAVVREAVLLTNDKRLATVPEVQVRSLPLKRDLDHAFSSSCATIRRRTSLVPAPMDINLAVW